MVDEHGRDGLQVVVTVLYGLVVVAALWKLWSQIKAHRESESEGVSDHFIFHLAAGGFVLFNSPHMIHQIWPDRVKGAGRDYVRYTCHCVGEWFLFVAITTVVSCWGAVLNSRKSALINKINNFTNALCGLLWVTTASTYYSVPNVKRVADVAPPYEVYKGSSIGLAIMYFAVSLSTVGFGLGIACRLRQYRLFMEQQKGAYLEVTDGDGGTSVESHCGTGGGTRSEQNSEAYSEGGSYSHSARGRQRFESADIDTRPSEIQRRLVDINDTDSVYKRMIVRLVTVMSLCSVCFLSKIICLFMLVNQIYFDIDSTNTSDIRDTVWLLAYHFLPDVIPLACLLFLMRKQSPATAASDDSGGLPMSQAAAH
jgi:hypothetical protein